MLNAFSFATVVAVSMCPRREQALQRTGNAIGIEVAHRVAICRSHDACVIGLCQGQHSSIEHWESLCTDHQQNTEQITANVVGTLWAVSNINKHEQIIIKHVLDKILALRTSNPPMERP